MAAVLFSAQTDVVLGELDNGLKMVLTTATLDAGITISQLTVSPLSRIVSFFPTFKKNTTNTVGCIFTAGTLANQVGVNPVASNSTGIIEILSFGY